MVKGVTKSKVKNAYTPVRNLHQLRDYKLYQIKNGKRIELPFGDISWRDNVDTLGMELNFNFPRNIDDRHWKRFDTLKLGDKLLFMSKDVELFRGIITGVDYDRYSKQITAHDYAFYLNESEIMIQFNKVKGHTAIRRLCKKANVPVGKIDNMSVTITEIYNGRVVSDILRDIIEQQKKHNGGEYIMEMRQNKLYVTKKSNLVLVPTYKPPARIKGRDKYADLAQISRSDTLSGMKTKVVIIAEEDKKTKTLATEVDAEHLNKYGLFQKVVSINKDEAKNAKKIAKQTLNEHKGVQSTISLTMLGDDKIRSGRVIRVQNDTYDLNGEFFITDCVQEYKNNNRWMKLTVRRNV